MTTKKTTVRPRPKSIVKKSIKHRKNRAVPPKKKQLKKQGIYAVGGFLKFD